MSPKIANLKASSRTVSPVNQTAYRILSLLRWLQAEPLTQEEIQKRFLDDPVSGNQALSNDTVWMYLNTLRQLGCKIASSRLPIIQDGLAPSGLGDKSRSRGYHLQYHPFCAPLNAYHTQMLIEARQWAEKHLNYEDLLALDQFMNHLLTSQQFKRSSSASVLLTAANQAVPISSFNTMRWIDYAGQAKIIKSLQQALTVSGNCVLQLRYYPATKWLKNAYADCATLWVRPQSLQYRSGALYLAGFSNRYKDLTFLRVDKIRTATPFFQDLMPRIPEAIKSELEQKRQNQTQIHLQIWFCSVAEWEAISETTGILTELNGPNEVLTEFTSETGNGLTLKTSSPDLFSLKQRLLALGKPFTIHQPDSFAHNMHVTLLTMKQRLSSNS